MDASFFYFAALELAEKIQGLRIEKVFSPRPQCWTIVLGRAGFLIVSTGRPQPFLFLSEQKPENPSQPNGQAMWLRKRLRNRKICDIVLDWPRRQMAWQLSPGEGSWFIVGLDDSPTIVDALPPEFSQKLYWPDVDTIIQTPRIWEIHPHITSPLRHFLASLSPAEAQDFLAKLQQGVCKTFYIGEDHKQRFQVALWPLQKGQNFDSALMAAKVWGQRLLFNLLGARTGQEAAHNRLYGRLKRNLARLQEDRKRLEHLIRGRDDALALQNILYTLEKSSHLSKIEVANDQGQVRILKLDPRLSVLENMTRLFARAAKGERGLPVVAAREAALQRELATAQAKVLPAPVIAASQSNGSPARLSIPARYRALKVASFCSSDGFLIFRGRSAQANHQLLTKAASPFDLWLHAQNGPGAHVIIKRDFPTQEVPETTILEAAGLAALASHLKMSAQGDVLVCLARDVRTIKGAALGMVEVTKVWRVVRVRIEPSLEDQLKLWS